MGLVGGGPWGRRVGGRAGVRGGSGGSVGGGGGGGWGGGGRGVVRRRWWADTFFLSATSCVAFLTGGIVGGVREDDLQGRTTGCQEPNPSLSPPPTPSIGGHVGTLMRVAPTASLRWYR